MSYKICFKYDAIVSHLDNVNYDLSCHKNILALMPYLSMGLLGVLSLVFVKFCLSEFLSTFNSILLSNVDSYQRFYKKGEKYS